MITKTSIICFIYLYIAYNIQMKLIFKYYVSCFILIFSLFLYYYLFLFLEPFTTDWNPTTDPNHVQNHLNEIAYLKDWITILDKGENPTESQHLKEFLAPKETHLKWHTDRLLQPPLTKQTDFLLF